MIHASVHTWGQCSKVFFTCFGWAHTQIVCVQVLGRLVLQVRHVGRNEENFNLDM